MICMACDGTGEVGDRVRVGPSDLFIDRDRGSLFYGEDEFRVTRRLFDLLDYLTKRQGRIVPIQTIFTNVWGGVWDRTADEGAVKVALAHLRKVLREHGVPANVISTHYGFGYGIL